MPSPRLTAFCCATLLLVAGAGAQELRDPMRPPGAARAAAPARAPAALKLEGVIKGPVRVAIVNGRLVRAGDSIAGAKIIEVLIDGVRYSRGDRVHSLQLPGSRSVAITRVAASSSEANTP
jgi:MSHA biogenesis protein MshK